MKFLILDDSVTMLRIIENVLNVLDHKDIVKALDGKTGLNIVKKSNIDVILTDWNMPIMNGLTFVKEVRKQNKSIPIIMITTTGEKERILEALYAGVNGYIIKPFTADTLREQLDKVLS